MRVLGIQRMDLRFDDGKEIHGVKLHGVDVDKQSTDLQGEAVDTVMIRDDNPVALGLDVQIGKEYNMYFGKGSKRVDLILPAGGK